MHANQSLLGCLYLAPTLWQACCCGNLDCFLLLRTSPLAHQQLSQTIVHLQPQHMCLESMTRRTIGECCRVHRNVSVGMTVTSMDGTSCRNICACLRGETNCQPSELLASPMGWPQHRCIIVQTRVLLTVLPLLCAGAVQVACAATDAGCASPTV